MFVRRVMTRPKGAASGISYRLVHAQRLGPGKTRQIVLAYFPAGLEERVPKPHWKRLAAAIKDLLAGQQAAPPAPDLGPDEQQIAGRIAAEAASVAPQARRRMLDLGGDFGFKLGDDPEPAKASEPPINALPSTLRYTDAREVGAARLLLRQARALGLPTSLSACGLRARQARLGLALILARALHPASERETLRWLRRDSALGELLDLEPADFSSNSIRKTADALWQCRAPIEQNMFSDEPTLFDVDARIVFCDLTNTHRVSRSAHEDSAGSWSERKRHGAPRVTLGVLLDGEGFLKRSEVFTGNLGEPSTLLDAIERLELPAGQPPTVVLAGVTASASSLSSLRERGVHWLTVERQRKAVREREPGSTRPSADRPDLKVWRLPAGEGTSAEARLCERNPARKKAERAMLARQRKRFEGELRSLHEGLSTPRRLKRLEPVLQKVGRLQEKYKLVSREYTVDVEEGEHGKAKAVTWKPNPRFRPQDRPRGTSLLRTSRVEWGDSRIVREYSRLADIEATFRSLTDEPDPEPPDDGPGEQLAGNGLVTALAYGVVHALRRELKLQGIRDSWASVRERTRTWTRLTTEMRTTDGKVWSQRADLSPSSDQERIAAAAGVVFIESPGLLPLDPSESEGNESEQAGERSQGTATASPLFENLGN